MSRLELDREQIVGRLQRELDARSEIALALLHGSFPKGGTYRDIDVAVWLNPARLSRDERFRYALDLSVQLHLHLGRPIDVRVLNDAHAGVPLPRPSGSPVSAARRDVPGRTARANVGRLPRLPAVRPAVPAGGAQ